MEFIKDDNFRNNAQYEETTPRKITQMTHESNKTPSGSPRKWWKYILASFEILIIVVTIATLVCFTKKEKKEEDIN